MGKQMPASISRRYTMIKMFVAGSAIVMLLTVGMAISLSLENDSVETEQRIEEPATTKPSDTKVAMLVPVKKPLPAFLTNLSIRRVGWPSNLHYIVLLGVAMMMMLLAVISASSASDDEDEDMTPSTTLSSTSTNQSAVNEDDPKLEPNEGPWWKEYLAIIIIGPIALIAIVVLFGGLLFKKAAANLPPNDSIIQRIEMCDPHDVGQVIDQDGALQTRLNALHKNCSSSLNGNKVGGWRSLGDTELHDVDQLRQAIENNMNCVFKRACHKLPLTERTFKAISMIPNSRFKDFSTFGSEAVDIYVCIAGFQNKFVDGSFFVLNSKRELTLEKFETDECVVALVNDCLKHLKTVKELQNSYIYVCRLAAGIERLKSWSKMPGELSKPDTT